MTHVSLQSIPSRFTRGAWSVAAALALATLTVSPVDAQGPMRVAPSGRATTEVVLTPVEAAAGAAVKPSVIRIDYGQPHLRGRQLHTDGFVPYDEAWRLGANGATMLVTDVDLVIGGANVPKGRYVLQAMPGRTGWKLLVQKETGQSPMAAAMSYDPANDIARIDLKQETLQMPLESFTMWLIPSTAAGPAQGELRLAWGTTLLSTTWSTR